MAAANLLVCVRRGIRPEREGWSGVVWIQIKKERSLRTNKVVRGRRAPAFRIVSSVAFINFRPCFEVEHTLRYRLIVAFVEPKRELPSKQALSCRFPIAFQPVVTSGGIVHPSRQHA